jgi:mRNA interferase HigB
VRAISQKRLKEFWTKHAAAEEKLKAWYKVVTKARWRSFAEVRSIYANVDKVGECYVFNIYANTRFRLIAKISHDWTVLLICTVLDHKEYDRAEWKEACICNA